MRRDLSVLLIEDDLAESQAIQQYIETKEGIHLVGSTDNILQAENYLHDLKPEAIILDLELHNGYGNGLDFLKNLFSSNLDYTPFILITTNNCSKLVYKQVRNLGADFIIAKYQQDYSAQTVVEFLISMKQSILNDYNFTPNILSSNTPESPNSKKDCFIKRISIELDWIGINPRVLGRQYLTQAIQLIIDNPSVKVCPIIASQFSKSDASVERAMQNAINQAWRTSNIDDLSKFYTARIRSDRGVPTYSEFIYYYADKIKNDY